VQFTIMKDRPWYYFLVVGLYYALLQFVFLQLASSCLRRPQARRAIALRGPMPWPRSRCNRHAKVSLTAWLGWQRAGSVAIAVRLVIARRLYNNLSRCAALAEHGPAWSVDDGLVRVGLTLHVHIIDVWHGTSAMNHRLH